MLNVGSDLGAPMEQGLLRTNGVSQYERKNAMQAMVTVSFVTLVVSGLAIMRVWKS